MHGREDSQSPESKETDMETKPYNSHSTRRKFIFVNRNLTNTLPAILPDYLTLILTARVYDVAIETPLQRANNLSTRLERNIFLKREDMQSVFSFKLRGAFNKMQQLSPIEKKAGVIACSAGNHAQGVALSAQTLGITATIVMPKSTPRIKTDAVRNLGGKVLLHGTDFDEARAEAKRLANEHGYVQIPPFDDPFVIAGNGTIAAEIFRQHEANDIAAIFVCCGGGGLLSGIAAYSKRVFPAVKIIGVESFDSAGMTSSLEAGHLVELDDVGLFAEGAAVRTVGKETFAVAKGLVDGMVLVTTDEICAAIKDVFLSSRTIVEPAGALAVAGMKKYLGHLGEGKKDVLGVGSKGSIVAISSGANMNFDRLRFVAERADIGENKEVLISVGVPERPGTFVALCRSILPRTVTEFIYRYQDHDTANIILAFRVKDEVSREEDVVEVFQSLVEKGFQPRDLSHNEMAKAHARNFGGGRKNVEQERLIRFRFPERSGELFKFLTTIDSTAIRLGINVTLWHYRNYGSDVGAILLGIQVLPDVEEEFNSFLQEFPYHHFDETHNGAYLDFLG